MEFNIEQPKIRFTNHLNVPFNDRIIFSAPFGTGKTYFLEQFFKENPNYDVIHLFPVNYSVANNQDIFELIKCDVLLELMNKGVEFNKKRIPQLKTLFKYSVKNLHQLIAPIAYAVPFLGKEAYEMYDKYQKLSIEYIKEHEAQQIDDKKTADKYLEEFNEIRGSVYESDFYTQLICKLVEQLKIDVSTDKKCETVLVIDDLDRIDPEHIFRILNVLSAHLDKRGEEGNKFNFDKIILVFDQRNVHKIFQNRYGSNVDFSGYIDKFYSYRIFDFENSKGVTESVLQCLQTIERPDNNTFLDFHSDSNLFGKNIVYILSALISCNRLTIRRLKKFIEKPFVRLSYRLFLNGNESWYYNKNFEISFIAEFLLSIFGSWDELFDSISNCREYINENTVSDHRKAFIGFCLVVLDSQSHQFQSGKEGVIFNHEPTDQSFTYNTQDWHQSHDGFLCKIQNVLFLSNALEKVDSIKYFPILLETLKKMESENLVKLP